MATRISVFTRDGVPLDELQCSVTLADALNKAERAIFSIAKTDPKATAANLARRNLVLVEDDAYGTWGGVIWKPRTWYYDRIEFTAYSAEFLLSFRRAPFLNQNGTPGDIFGYLIDQVNLSENLRVQRGSIDRDNRRVDLSTKFDNMYDAVAGFANRVGNDFAFTPARDANNNLFFFANWYQRRGTTSDFILEYSYDTRKPGGWVMQEQGEIINNVLTFSTGTQGYVGIGLTYEDAVSRATYGLIEGVQSDPSIVDSTLDARSLAALAYYKSPRNTFKLEVKNDATKRTFQHLNLGDTVRLMMADVGFYSEGGLGIDTNVRILAREYDPEAGTMMLTVDEVIS